MATINCPHCGKEMFDELTTCPHCGGPVFSETLKRKVEENIRVLAPKAEKDENKFFNIVTLALLSFMSLVTIVVFIGLFIPNIIKSGGNPVTVIAIILGTILGFVIGAIMIIPFFGGFVYTCRFLHPIKRIQHNPSFIIVTLVMTGIIAYFGGWFFYCRALFRKLSKKPLLSEKDIANLISIGYFD